ncbi:hypothetical protein LCGC14_1212580 [marine sediment metagenome]|uniref:Uncharacterized protein n=1 Tax=marine sediment metagenome TaxID=412755 RepID=A0A0F9LDI5_9ZZZZ
MKTKENFDNFMDAWNSLTEDNGEEVISADVSQEPKMEQESFNIMVEEVADLLPEIEDSLPEDLKGPGAEIESNKKVEQILSEVCQTNNSGSEVKEKILDIKNEQDLEVIDLSNFDKLLDSDVKKSKKVEKIEGEEEPVPIDKKMDEKQTNGLAKKINFKNGKIEFFLESPSKLFDQFYGYKRELVEDLTPGEQLLFDDLTRELIGCNVDIRTEVFDNREYIRQMTVIQGFMGRVKNIQVTCNNQYFVWEEFLPNIKGCLARVEYLKPAIKQEGFVHEHMRDLVWYYSKLKHLHESCKGVVKILERAFETISRKASITTPSRQSEQYQRSNRPEEKRYDTLPVENKIKKDASGFCTWEEIK